MIETERLILRRWRDDDADAYAALHAEPEVAYWLGGRMPHAQALGLFETLRTGLDGRGWGMWAVERRDDGAWLGTVGLDPVREDLPLAPATEASWRLAPAAWGHGYVTEAMAPIVADAWSRGERELVSFTASTNTRSQAVMTRLGFRRDGASDFDHPRLPPDHSMRRHVVYRLARPAS